MGNIDFTAIENALINYDLVASLVVTFCVIIGIIATFVFIGFTGYLLSKFIWKLISKKK